MDCLFAHVLPLEEFVTCNLFSEKVTSCYKKLRVAVGDKGLLSLIVVNGNKLAGEECNAIYTDRRAKLQTASRLGPDIGKHLTQAFTCLSSTAQHSTAQGSSAPTTLCLNFAPLKWKLLGPHYTGNHWRLSHFQKDVKICSRDAQNAGHAMTHYCHRRMGQFCEHYAYSQYESNQKLSMSKKSRATLSSKVRNGTDTRFASSWTAGSTERHLSHHKAPAFHGTALTLRMRLHSRYQQAMPADIK